MNREDIIRKAREAGLYSGVPRTPSTGRIIEKRLEAFAALVAAAERNKLAQWMIDRGYATGHGDTTEDLLEELDWQITESWSKVVMASVEAEREACAKVCESRATPGTGSVAILNGAADAIRARGETK